MPATRKDHIKKYGKQSKNVEDRRGAAVKFTHKDKLMDQYLKRTEVGDPTVHTTKDASRMKDVRTRWGNERVNKAREYVPDEVGIRVMTKPQYGGDTSKFKKSNAKKAKFLPVKKVKPKDY